ncbi:DUF421 domain-containing protein [Pseudonocardia charpentierae]|uniref:DUF421 domain-containing protein n=1 Tax=Pseudonocardia charpentierae TaxID=3075545 RepID=A0ABU2NAY3_9PSEU|nr:YetF domain-containing protein [Pseudonocardia sp. DSM 45834]MDT0349824.1 hypothetical protein [Pseudonocardia sp. DSM 45834]
MEVVVRAVVIFLFLWLVTRVVGRSTLGELSTFQLLLYVTMGDLVQQSVTQQDYSVTSGVLAVSVFALLTILVSWANTRWRRIRPLVHGVPVVIMKAGEPLLDVMTRERMSISDLMASAREKGGPTADGGGPRGAGDRRQGLVLHGVGHGPRGAGEAVGRLTCRGGDSDLAMESNTCSKALSASVVRGAATT